MTLLLNLLWFVLGGFISGTLWLLAAAVLAITLIGLPWVPAALRLAGFSYFPFGRKLAEHDPGVISGVLNLIWLVLAGWWLALHHLVLAIALGVTVIGIPFAWKHLQLAAASLTPVGKTVVPA